MKRYARPTAVALGLVAAVVFTWTIVSATLYSPQTEVAAPGTVTTAAPQLVPQRLRISAIDLDVHVQQAGLIDGNRMAAPTNFSDVAWYKYGPAPGEVGSAVIAGHLDNGLGLTGVFKNLDQLQPGDDIAVINASGDTLHYTVQRIVTYPYDQVPSSLFTGADTARLNLITCAGRWIKTKKLGWTVDHRLVVYAVLSA